MHFAVRLTVLTTLCGAFALGVASSDAASLVSPTTTQAIYGQSPDPTPAGQVIWGDQNCSGVIDPGDALVRLRRAAYFLAEVPPLCPDDLQVVQSGATYIVWADLDCNGYIQGADIIPILRSLTGVPAQAANCPEIGAKVQLANVGK